MIGGVTIVAMYADGLRSSHPISVDVNDPAEIDEIFDSISYEKVIHRIIKKYKCKMQGVWALYSSSYF